MIRYFVLSNIAICLFYILYKTLLQNDTFFSLKRLLLLAMLVFSITFPVMWWSEFCIETPDEFSNFSVLFLNNKALSSTAPTPGSSMEISWVALLYYIVVGLLCLQFFVRLISIFRLKRSAIQKEISGYSVNILQKKITPFTFFNMIFVDTETIQKKETLPLILRHESAHKRQLHSIDTIFAEIVGIFFFFNPFVWLFKKEILLNLECIADSAVKQNISNLSAYQYAILNIVTHKKALSFTNQFNISNLKKRIIMLNKNTSKKRELIKYLSIVPIAAGLLLTSHLSAANNGEALSFINKEKKDTTRTFNGTWTPVGKGKKVPVFNGKFVKVSDTPLEWVKTDIDLGEVPQGVPATATYEFVNKGKTPIIITNVKTSCGCTTKEYTKEPIPSGQKGVVKATYNAKKLGKFGKTITVTVNDNKLGKVQLRIRGTVVAKK